MSKRFKEIIFEETYKSFNEFYSNNDLIIYQNVIEIFQEFANTKKKKLVLFVRGQINDTTWDTEFNFSKDESIILTRDLLPYFEKIEDFETCKKIKELSEYFNKKTNKKREV